MKEINSGAMMRPSVQSPRIGPLLWKKEFSQRGIAVAKRVTAMKENTALTRCKMLLLRHLGSAIAMSLRVRSSKRAIIEKNVVKTSFFDEESKGDQLR